MKFITLFFIIYQLLIPFSENIRQRRKIVPTSKQEILLLLRAYQARPGSWNDVVLEVKENIHLPKAGPEMYKRSTQKQLRNRLSTKLEKVMAADICCIKDHEIRSDFYLIKMVNTIIFMYIIFFLPENRLFSVNP